MTDICQFFQALCSGFSHLLALQCYEASPFLVVDQHNVRPILKQMFFSLDREVSENHGVIVPDYSFWFYPLVFIVLEIVLGTYDPVYY